MTNGLLAFALAGAALAGAAPSGESTEALDATLTQLKRDLVEAYIDRNAAELARIYCDDFTATDAQGKSRTKADELANLNDRSSTLRSGSYDPIAIRFFGDVAVFYGHGELKGDGADGPFHASYDSFNVFVKGPKGWCYAAAYTP